MSLLSFGMPFGAHIGQLAINTNVEISNILFSEAATAGKIMAFDMQLAVATSYDPMAGSSGAGTSAWAFIRNYIVDTAVLHYTATDVYVCAPAAVSAGARGRAVVMGAVTNALVTGAPNVAKGQQLRPSMASIGSLSVCAAQGTTLRAESRTRKAILLVTTAASSVTTATGHFNGFGWGVTLFIPGTAAFNVDS